MYICASCGREIEQFGAFVRCPHCAHRIVYKPALPVARNVKAR